MIEEMSKEGHIDPVEAQEFIEYNTLRALPYMPKNKPIILDVDSLDEIEKKLETLQVLTDLMKSGEIQVSEDTLIDYPEIAEELEL